MASGRSAGPTVGALVPVTITGPSSLAATTAYLIPLPSCKYRVGRITIGGTVATDTYTVSVGNSSSATAFLNAQSCAVGAQAIDAASADLTEKTATGGTSYLIVTFTQSTTATFANATVTIWMWMSSPPPSIARRGDPGSLNQQGL